MIEQHATTIGRQPNRYSRFEVAAPRHFLLPAILLLLAEEPRHGYGLAKDAQKLQVGRVDRPSVYRALAQLERDGLVVSSPETPRPGRHVYQLTDDGEQVLRQWMSVIKQERDGLDRVLRRYAATGTVDAVLAEVEGRWHTVTAPAWSSVSSTSRIDRKPVFPVSAAPRVEDFDAAGTAADDPPDASVVGRYRVVPSRSVVLVDARSSVGPITFGAIGVTGFIEAAVDGRQISTEILPQAQLQLQVDKLQSGNGLYDAELLRRVDARRYPTVALNLQACEGLGSTGRYQIAGEVTFHGVTRALGGTVVATMASDHKIVVRGEQVVDIRDFGIASPTVLMLRIYPDVVVKLQIEAEREVSAPIDQCGQ